MILDLLLGTIAVTTPLSALRSAPQQPPASPPVPVRIRMLCRSEFGADSLVRRYRVCHAAAEWQAIDARRRARHRQGG